MLPSHSKKKWCLHNCVYMNWNGPPQTSDKRLTNVWQTSDKRLTNVWQTSDKQCLHLWSFFSNSVRCGSSRVPSSRIRLTGGKNSSKLESLESFAYRMSFTKLSHAREGSHSCLVFQHNKWERLKSHLWMSVSPGCQSEHIKSDGKSLHLKTGSMKILLLKVEFSL